MNYAAALGLIGTIIGLIRALPQLIGLLRSGKANGVSPDSAATSSLVSFAWTTYGLITDQLFVVLAAGASGVIFALVSILSIRFGRGIDEFRVAPIWLFIMIVCGSAFGVAGLGAILPISVLASNIPQLLVAYRESDLTDLSLGTWALNFSDGLVWGIYSLIQSDIYILTSNSFQMITSAAIILLKITNVYGKRNLPINTALPRSVRPR